MANDYFNAPATPVDFTTARASQIKALFASIAAGFDLFPSRTALLQGRFNYAVAGGDGNNLTAAFTVPNLALVDGASFRLRLTNTNSGAATLAIDGLGARAVLKTGGVALAGGELAAGAIQDFTYNQTLNAFILPATGPQGPQGPQGPANGTQLLNGSAPPGGGTGNNGDFFIETSAGVPYKVYGPKAAGAWPAGVLIQGPAGANGANGTNGFTMLTSNGVPSNGVGVNGDYNIDTLNWKIHGPKAGGVWPAGVSIVGPQGIAGANGAPGVVDTTANYNFTHANGISNNGKEVGFRDLVISRTVAGAFALAAADRGKSIIYTGSGHAGTIPANASVAIGVESLITILNNGSGNITLTRAGGVAMKWAGNGGTDANRTLAVGGMAWLWKIATDTWFVGGTGLT